MPRKMSIEPVESAKASTAPPLAEQLTPEQKLKAELEWSKFKKDLKSTLSKGVDLSKQETP